MYAADICSFMLPLLHRIDLDHFSYARTFLDHTGYCITTHPRSSELFISKKLYKTAFVDDVKNYVDGFYLWDFFMPGTELGNVVSEQLDARFGVTIIRNHIKFCETFHELHILHADRYSWTKIRQQNP